VRFSGVMVGTHDSDALGAFYTKVLGEPTFQTGPWYGWMDGGQLVVGAHSDVRGTSTQPQRMMLMIEVDDVATQYERLTGLGAEAVAEPYQPDGGNGGWLATIADPDGNYVQLHTPMSD
jgi:predicted enzyme related to lactoylglutathione lyase